MGCGGSEDDHEHNAMDEEGEEELDEIEPWKSKNFTRTIKIQDEMPKSWQGKNSFPAGLLDIREKFIKDYGEIEKKIDEAKYPAAKKDKVMKFKDKTTKISYEFYGNQETKNKMATGFGFLKIISADKKIEPMLYEGFVKDWKPMGLGRMFANGGKDKDASGKDVDKYIAREAYFNDKNLPYGEGHMLNSLGERFDGLFTPNPYTGTFTNKGGKTSKGIYDASLNLETGAFEGECGTWSGDKIKKEMTYGQVKKKFKEAEKKKNQELKTTIDNIKKASAQKE